jgi:hypothetical protein
VLEIIYLAIDLSSARTTPWQKGSGEKCKPSLGGLAIGGEISLRPTFQVHPSPLLAIPVAWANRLAPGAAGEMAPQGYGCNAFPLPLKFYRNRRAVICDREFVGA